MKGAIVTVFSGTANVTIANTQERSLAGAGVGSLLLPANFLEVGSSLRILVNGVYSTASAGDLTIRVKLGPIVLDTGTGVTSKSETNQPFEMVVTVVCRKVGKTGTVIAAGSIRWAVTKPVTGLPDFIPQTTPVVVDTTTPSPLDVTCQWSALGNSITTTHLLVWSEQPV